MASINIRKPPTVVPKIPIPAITIVGIENACKRTIIGNRTKAIEAPINRQCSVERPTTSPFTNLTLLPVILSSASSCS